MSSKPARVVVDVTRFSGAEAVLARDFDCAPGSEVTCCYSAEPVSPARRGTRQKALAVKRRQHFEALRHDDKVGE